MNAVRNQNGAQDVLVGRLYVAPQIGQVDSSKWGKICYITRQLYSMRGFTDLAKSFIAYIHLLEFAPQIGGVFKEALNTLEAQKDFLYATSIFESWGNLVALNTNKDNRIDIICKVLTAAGDFFETGGYLKKYLGMKFPLFSQVAANLAPITVFSYNGQRWTVGDTPVLRELCRKPKDFLVFIVSFLEVFRHGKLYFEGKDECGHWERIFKTANCTGKMFLIATNREWGSTLGFALIDTLTQSASLIKTCVTSGKAYDRNLAGYC
jgi:hypothetical protein